MKLAVEQCFIEGLLGAVFATETLSLGINMPARTVVIERFSKFGGAGRATLTSGEYAQLTGRAGRRGLDDEGHAVIVFSPETPFADMARVALAPPPDLHSSFRPTYNLTANLVGRFDRATAHEVLVAQLRPVRDRPPRGAPAPPAHRDPRAAPRGARRARLRRRLVAHRARPGPPRRLPRGRPARRRGRARRGARRARALARRGGAARRSSSSRVARGASGTPGRARSPAARGARASDRLGQRRREELAERLGDARHGSRRRSAGLEDVHLVPHTRAPEPQAAAAVAAWARGAPLGDALAVVARDAGRGRPGRLRPHRPPGGGPLRAGRPPRPGPRDRPRPQRRPRRPSCAAWWPTCPPTVTAPRRVGI